MAKRVVQVTLDADIWFDFRLECHRLGMTIPEGLERVLGAQIQQWRAAQRHKNMEETTSAMLTVDLDETVSDSALKDGA